MQERTFNEIAKKWLQTACIGVSFTWQNQLTSNVKHLNRYIGKKIITEITSFDIDAVIKNLSIYNPNTKKPASKRLLKTISHTANQIFEYAVENGFMNKNPAAKATKKIPKNAPTQIVEALSEQQMSVVTEFNSSTKLAAVIMMFMGLRTGELLALKWRDLDFNNCTVNVNKSCTRVKHNRYMVKQGTKNGKVRIVPIPTSIIEWLESKWLESTTELVFPNKEGLLHTPTSWRNCWTAYQNDLNYYTYREKCIRKGITPKNKYCPTGIPDMNIRFKAHQLRHTFATMLYLSRVDVITAKELMGHSDIQTTLGIYTHLDEKFKKINIIKFDNYIQNELLKASSL